MASAPKQKPLINIPGIKSAKRIEMVTRDRGERLVFRMFIGNKTLKEVKFDPDNEWMDRSWFGLVIRELDRLKVWHYDTTENKDGTVAFVWSCS